MFVAPLVVGDQATAQKAESEGEEPKQSIKVLEPRYEVDVDARDPFFPPQDEEAGKGALSLKAFLEKAVSALNVSGLGTTGPRSGTVIIDGRMLKVGDGIKVEVEGHGAVIEIKRFKPKSRSVVFGYKDETVTVSMLNES